MDMGQGMWYNGVNENYLGGGSMELGERIKQARLEAGLSQRQLCGERLTRNMLSLIENGSARPSMDTLRYFAQQLGRPLGWFLEEQAVVSPNQDAMADARACWAAGDGHGVLEALENYKAPDAVFDSERGLLGYLATLQLAQAALEEKKLPYAKHLLAEAANWESPYITPAQQQKRQMLLAWAGEAADLDDGPLLARAMSLLDAPERALGVLRGAKDRNAARWLYLTGQAEFALKEYAKAAEHLAAVESLHPEVVAMLEVCYRELGDFKKAYEYACKGRG